MGWEIVWQESLKYPGKHNRLWIHEDVSDALTRNTIRPKYMNFVCVFPFCIYKLYRWRGNLNNFNLFEKLTYMYNFNKVLHIYVCKDRYKAGGIIWFESFTNFSLSFYLSRCIFFYLHTCFLEHWLKKRKQVISLMLSVFKLINDSFFIHSFIRSCTEYI